MYFVVFLRDCVKIVRREEDVKKMEGVMYFFFLLLGRKGCTGEEIPTLIYQGRGLLGSGLITYVQYITRL